jgi:hypothetical protein
MGDRSGSLIGSVTYYLSDQELVDFSVGWGNRTEREPSGSNRSGKHGRT